MKPCILTNSRVLILNMGTVSMNEVQVPVQKYPNNGNFGPKLMFFNKYKTLHLPNLKVVISDMAIRFSNSSPKIPMQDNYILV